MAIEATISGNLGADPEVRWTQGGQQVTDLRICATARRQRRGPDAELWYVRALAWCAAHPETDGVIPLEVAVNRLGIPDAMSRVNICESYGLITKNDDSVSVTPWVKWIGKWRDIQERAAKLPATGPTD